MKQPNLDEFLEYLEKNNGIELSEYQKNLAGALINYRVKHFSGGLRSGRTTVVNAIQLYFQNIYPVENSMSREI